jgi:O-antigen/teichoic acid export membrane protein
VSIREKTISGMSWSFAGGLSLQGITFVVGVILARLLTPQDFGLIAIITAFISISEIFVNSGFNEALIRKAKTTEIDYSTIFYYNLFVSIVLYIIIFLCSGLISNFFGEPSIDIIIKVLGLVLIINALSIIQRTILTKLMSFRRLTKVEFIASLVAGAMGISTASLGWGVWSLVSMIIIRSLIQTVLLWSLNTWRPSFVFSIKSFKELFLFGGNLLALAIIDGIYLNIFNFIIAKFYSSAQLGYYNRSESLRNLSSKTITGVIQKVSYPILSEIQDDKVRLKSAYKRLVKSTCFVTFIPLIGIASVADNLVIVLLGEQWFPSIEYLQLLCFAGLFFPLHSLNSNILKVAGNSSVILKIGIVLKLLGVPVLLTGVLEGISEMIIALILQQFIGFCIYSIYAGPNINYNLSEQLKDIFPPFAIAISMGVLMYSIGFAINVDKLMKLFVEICSGVFLVISISELFRIESYLYLKNIFIKK